MPTVLVADDAVDVRNLVRAVLERDGIDVVLAATGAEAIEAMVRRRPDAVLLDINMPLIDGLEVLRRITSHPELAAVPVMILTAHGIASNVQQALQAGARDFMVKPFDPGVLRERVQKLLDSPRPEVIKAPAPPPRRVGPVPVIPTRVLVADDHPTVLELARDLLADRYGVTTVRSGAGALEAALKEHPAAVVLDLDMPLMDGPESLFIMHSRPELSGMKAIAMVSGEVSPERLRGFDGTARKPLDRTDLLRALCRVLGTTGLHAFVLEDVAIVLRFFDAKLWDPAAGEVGSAFWETRDVERLQAECERVFGWMQETRQLGLLFDLSRIEGLPERQVGAVVGVARAVVQRAQACRLNVALVVSFHQRATFDRLRDELSVPVVWRTPEALRLLRRRGG